jgi:hypothetical protein
MRPPVLPTPFRAGMIGIGAVGTTVVDERELQLGRRAARSSADVTATAGERTLQRHGGAGAIAGALVKGVRLELRTEGIAGNTARIFATGISWGSVSPSPRMAAFTRPVGHDVFARYLDES